MNYYSDIYLSDYRLENTKHGFSKGKGAPQAFIIFHVVLDSPE